MNKTGVEEEARAESPFPGLIKLPFCCMFPNTDSGMGAIRLLPEISLQTEGSEAPSGPIKGQPKVLRQEFAPVFSAGWDESTVLAECVPLVHPADIYSSSSGNPQNSKPQALGGGSEDVSHSDTISCAKAEAASRPNIWRLVH